MPPEDPQNQHPPGCAAKFPIGAPRISKLSVFEDLISNGKMLNFTITVSFTFRCVDEKTIRGTKVLKYGASARKTASLGPAMAPSSRYHIWHNSGSYYLLQRLLYVAQGRIAVAPVDLLAGHQSLRK